MSSWRALGLLVLGALPGCAEGSTNFDAKYAPGFHEGPAVISVLGVYHEGRMSPEIWSQVGPPLSAALGERSCEVGYGDKLQGESPELYAAIDESTRSEGITEDLLDKLAPSAAGDAILVISVHGRAPTGKKLEGQSAAAAAISQPGRGSRMRGSRGPGPSRGGVEQPEMGMAATLFSVKQRRAVARLNMIYTGTNLDDAIAKFVARLGTVVPGSSCRGWKWGAPPASP